MTPEMKKLLEASGLLTQLNIDPQVSTPENTPLLKFAQLLVERCAQLAEQNAPFESDSAILEALMFR